jgi:hypothetical protein
MIQNQKTKSNLFKKQSQTKRKGVCLSSLVGGGPLCSLSDPWYGFLTKV